MLGSLSLSIIVCYLFARARLDNETILIFESNVVLNKNFKERYNKFYDYLPANDWEILDLHSYIEHKENRKKINDYVMLGDDEHGGSKAYIIKPSSLFYIKPLPIFAAADGIKNWISGDWVPSKGYITINPNKYLITTINNKNTKTHSSKLFLIQQHLLL